MPPFAESVAAESSLRAEGSKSFLLVTESVVILVDRALLHMCAGVVIYATF